jgi:hypothetical protein
VAVGAGPEDLQVDPAGVAEGLLVVPAGGGQVLGEAGGGADRARGEVDARGDLGVEDGRVPLRVVLGQPDVFVVREALRARERDLACSVPAGELSWTVSGLEPVARPRAASGRSSSSAPIASATRGAIDDASGTMPASMGPPQRNGNRGASLTAKPE